MSAAGGARPDAPAVAAVRHELKTPRAAGIAGLVFAALFVVSILLLEHHPELGSSSQEVADFYAGSGRKISLVGLYLAPFAGIAFLWFIATLRSRIGEREDRFFATVFLGSGLLFVAMLFAAAAASGAALAGVEFKNAGVPDSETLDVMRALSYALLYIYGIRAAAVFMLVTSTIGLRTGALPRWLAFVGYAMALLLLVSVSFNTLVVLIFPAWVAVASVVMLLRTEETDAGGGSADAGPPPSGA